MPESKKTDISDANCVYLHNKLFIMQRLGKYQESDGMSFLINDNYRILLVMSRFGIGLGFGDNTIDEVCRENGVDTKTFLAIVNMLLDEDGLIDYSKAEVSIASLLFYLHNSHDYFLDFRLPVIRNELVDILDNQPGELSQAIIYYFDEYVSEVRKHMMYEEETVFPYVRALLRGEKDKDYNVSIFGTQHDRIESRLHEFKNILIKYYPAKSTNEINGLLFDIFNCESDLASHNAIENRLFIPAITEYEQTLIK